MSRVETATPGLYLLPIRDTAVLLVTQAAFGTRKAALLISA